MTVPPRFRPRMLPRDLAVCVAAGCAIAASGRTVAQEAPPAQLDPVVVTATRSAERAFDLPIAIARREVSASRRRRESRYCTIGIRRVGIEKQTGQWLVRGFGRINNFTNVNCVGSVIDGGTNGRYFEPAATRNFLVGVSLNASF